MAEFQESINLAKDVSLTQVLPQGTLLGSDYVAGASPFAGTLKSVVAASTDDDTDTTLLVAVDGTNTNGNVPSPGPGAGQANSVSVALGPDGSGVSVSAGSLITVSTGQEAQGNIAITYVIG